MSKIMLPIVDAQNGLVSDRTRHVVPKIAELARQTAADFAFTTQFSNGLGSPYERFLHWHRLRDADECAIAPELAVLSLPALKKQVYTAFTAELRQVIEETQVSTVMICGIDTDCCVLTTAVDLFQAGIRPLVLADYCASNGGIDGHHAALRVLQRLIGADQIQSGDAASWRANDRP